MPAQQKYLQNSGFGKNAQFSSLSELTACLLDKVDWFRMAYYVQQMRLDVIGTSKTQYLNLHDHTMFQNSDLRKSDTFSQNLAT